MGRPNLDELDWQRLTRYVAGRCSSEERARIDAWAAKDPVRQRLIDTLKRIWKASAEPSTSVPDDRVDADWQELQRRMRSVNVYEPAPGRPAIRRARRRRRKRVSVKPAFWLPIILLIAFAGALFIVRYGSSGRAQGTAVLQEVSTERGQRARIRLSDGTVVQLNVLSKLTLPDRFAEGRREVTLEGEAFFQVTSDPDWPFTVHAGAGSVTAIGTAFDVDAYEPDDIAVVVSDGKVALQSRLPEGEDSVHVARGQRGRVAVGQQPRVRAVEVDRLLAWMGGQLSFDATPLSRVAVTLERWYNVDVEIAGSEMQQRRLTATFDDESLSVILDVIAEAVNAQYERDGRTVTFRQ